MSIEFLDYLKRGRDIHIKPSLAVEKWATVLTKQLCDINFFNLISYTSWLSVRGKTSCKLHKMCFRRLVGTSTSRVFKNQNGCHVSKGKMRFYSPCGSCFVVKPSVCILPLVCSLHFTPGLQSAIRSLRFTLTDYIMAGDLSKLY